MFSIYSAIFLNHTIMCRNLTKLQLNIDDLCCQNNCYDMFPQVLKLVVWTKKKKKKGMNLKLILKRIFYQNVWLKCFPWKKLRWWAVGWLVKKKRLHYGNCFCKDPTWAYARDRLQLYLPRNETTQTRPQIIIFCIFWGNQPRVRDSWLVEKPKSTRHVT